MGSSTFPFFVFSYLRPWRAPVYYSQKPSKCHPKNEAAYSLFSWPHGIHQTSEKRNTLYIFFQPYFLTLFRVSSDLDQKAYGFRFPTVAWRDHNQFLGQIFWEVLGEKITIIIHLLGDPGPIRQPGPVGHQLGSISRSSCGSMRNAFGRKRWAWVCSWWQI